MNSLEIQKMEQTNHAEIHLLRAGGFMHAYNRSAFHFSRHFFEYEVHCKYVKKINAEMLYLGFPNSSLPQIQTMAQQKKMNFTKVDDNHFVISNFWVYSDYDLWKREKFKAHAEKSAVEDSVPSEQKNSGLEPPALPNQKPSHSCDIKPAQMMFATKEFYECTRYIVGRTSEISRSLRVSIVERIRNACLDLYHHLDLCQHGLENFDKEFSKKQFIQISEILRLLMDLKQISKEQWFYISDKLLTVKKTLRLQSSDSRVAGDAAQESSSPLAPG